MMSPKSDVAQNRFYCNSFLHKAQNNCTNKLIRIDRYLLLFFFNFGMSQMFLVIQSLNQFEKVVFGL